jgi:hypothetical protein
VAAPPVTSSIACGHIQKNDSLLGASTTLLPYLFKALMVAYGVSFPFGEREQRYWGGHS